MNENRNILVVLPVEPRHQALLESAAPGWSFIYSNPKECTEEQVRSAAVIIGNVPAAKIGASENLRLLQLNSAGADAYIVPGALSEGTLLANATGAYSKAVAEHLFAVALMLQKKLQLYRDDQREALWADEGKVTSMADATVLVVGMGDIGTHFARLCKAMGAHTVGVRRRSSAPAEGVDEVYLTDQLDTLLPRADVIASFLPGSGATRGFYGKERFALMREDAIFLNGGRGSAVDQEALLEALHEKKCFRAGLDVTTPEPLPAESPLWQEKNLVITPHISGGYHLPETFECIIQIAADNLCRFVQGQPIRNEVDFSTGYKK